MLVRAVLDERKPSAQVQRHLCGIARDPGEIAILNRWQACEKIQLMRQQRKFSIDALSQLRCHGLRDLHVMGALGLGDLPKQDRQKRNARRNHAEKPTFHMRRTA